MTTTDNNDEAIAGSDRICAHMNHDHAVTVYAMARDTMSWREQQSVKITNAKLQSVSLSSYTVSFVHCKGSVCEFKYVQIPLEPPLSSASEARSRLIEIHHLLLAPKFHWLVTDPLALLILVICALLGYATFFVDNLPSTIADIFSPQLLDFVQQVFGSVARFAIAIKWSWWFAMAVHFVEAMVGWHECESTLELETFATFRWFLLIQCVGYPVFIRLWRLVRLQKQAIKRASSKKTRDDKDE